MILDNSFRIMLSKLGLIGRVLVYGILCLVLILGIGLAVSYPLVTELSNLGYLDKLSNFIGDNLFNFRIDQLLNGIAVLNNDFWDIIMANTNLLPYVISFIVVVVLGGYFLLGLAEIPLCECIYGYMGSLSRLNYWGYFISSLAKSVKQRLAKLITTFPLDLIIIATFFALLQLFFVGGVVTTLAPFIIILALLFLISVRQSLFALWNSSMVVNNLGAWKALKQNFKIVFKNFKTVFGATFFAVIIAFAINFGLSALTCGVGLLISLPATMLYFQTLYTVIYFHFNGLKYYIDKDRIIVSKKLEDNESVKNMRFII